MKSAKVLCVLSVGLCLAWLMLAFMPASPEDAHGYDRLMTMIGVSFLFIPLALISVVYSLWGFVSWPFSLSLLSVAPVHLIASQTHSGLDILLFLLPMAAALFFGVHAWKNAG